jgi:FkbM family methyltransferase
MRKKRKTLIFVGSAPLPHDFSEFIDSCDCVVRFNNCKNYGGNSGTKTDILVLNNSGDPDTMQTLQFMLKPRTAEEVARNLPYLNEANEIIFARPPVDSLIDFVKTEVAEGPLKETELTALRPGRDLAAEIATAQQIPAGKIKPLPSPEFYIGVWKKLLAFGPTDAYAPSTGMMGVEILLADPRVSEYQKFITGFGGKLWKGHPQKLERQLTSLYSDQNVLKFLSRRRALVYRELKKLIPMTSRVPKIKEKPNSEKKLRQLRKLCRRLPKHIPEPFFVKIGANDGISGDPISSVLLKNTQWKGLLIEPVPYCFDLLEKNFSDTNRFTLERIAVGTKSGQAPFYYVSQTACEQLPDIPRWFNQLGSFDRNHIIKHLDGVLEPFIIECAIQVKPLSDILAENRIPQVHLLHIDTEGYDYEIFKTIDLKNCPPLILFIEHRHLSRKEKQTMKHMMRRSDYAVHDCGNDYLAIHHPSIHRLGLKGIL